MNKNFLTVFVHFRHKICLITQEVSSSIQLELPLKWGVPYIRWIGLIVHVLPNHFKHPMAIEIIVVAFISFSFCSTAWNAPGFGITVYKNCPAVFSVEIKRNLQNIASLAVT